MKRGRALALPATVIDALSRMQSGLNSFIDAQWLTNRTPDDWGLAITLESGELIDSYPWKWWKNINAQPDFKNVRIELVDILHFSLSGTRQVKFLHDKASAAAISAANPNSGIASHVRGVEDVVALPLSDTANAVKTFRNVIDLTRSWRFDVITETVIVAADDLEFNLVAYYVAKHTLNYIRQLGGYKSGAYKKVNAGVEDNELLHGSIHGITIEEATGEESHEACWARIMAAVFDSFSVQVAERKQLRDWLVSP